VTLIEEKIGSLTVQAMSAGVKTSNGTLKAEATVATVSWSINGALTIGGETFFDNPLDVYATAGEVGGSIGHDGLKFEATAVEVGVEGSYGPVAGSVSFGVGVEAGVSVGGGKVKLEIMAGVVGFEVEVDMGVTGKVKEMLAEKAESDRAQAESARAERAKAERAKAERDQRTSKAAESCGANAECLREPTATAE
jgi:hypothetical protein